MITPKSSSWLTQIENGRPRRLHSKEERDSNPFEKACREYLKGCSVSLFYGTRSPRECPECLEAFLDHIEKLGKEK